MRNSGYVVRTADGVAEVVPSDHPACGRCGACLAGQARGELSFWAANDVGAGIGQHVEIEIPPGRAVLASFLVFILPLLGGFAGGLAGHRFAGAAGLSSTAGALIAGSVFFLTSFTIGRSIERACFGAPSARIVGPCSREASLQNGRAKLDHREGGASGWLDI